MRKIVLIMLAVLLAFAIVSCKQEVSKYEEKGYSVGDYGPAGGKIFYINPNADADGWKYLEVWTEKLSAGYNVYYSTLDNTDNANYVGSGSDKHLKTESIGAEEGMGKGLANTEKWVKAQAAGHAYKSVSKYASFNPTKYGEDDFAFSIADKMKTGGKGDWFIPSVEEAKELLKSGVLSGESQLFTSNQKLDDESLPIGATQKDSFPVASPDPNYTHWYAIRRF